MEYAITARKTVKPITKNHYFDYLDKIGDLGEIGNVNFETTKGLHCHFILKTKTKISNDSIRPTKRGWNCRKVPIRNHNLWKAYCRKDRELGENDPPEEEFKMPTKCMFKRA